MANLPLNVTAFGIGSDKLGDKFHIYFLSVHNARKLYLADGELTEDLSQALQTDDMNFIAGELATLISDDDFMEYLESEMVL